MRDRIMNAVEEWAVFIWLTVVIGILAGVVAFVASTPDPQHPCSYFADYQMKDVPARCITYFTHLQEPK